MAVTLTTKRKPPKSDKTAAQALYLYGITRLAAGKSPAGQGVDGLSQVEPVRCAGLLCWISRVNRTAFADRLAQNMENLEWLAAASVRHQRVVSEIAARTSILPARFGTVFLSEASLASHVAEHKRRLLAALKRIAGTDEWGVKVFAIAPPSAPAPSAASGTEYLRRKAAAIQPVAHKTLHPEVQSFATALRKIAVDTAVGGKVSGGQRNLEWQGSFLLRRSRQRQWRLILDRYAERWHNTRRIECTGPWPPYSFVSTHGR